MVGRVSTVFLFFKQKTAYEIKECDWSSDVCSSDLKIIGVLITTSLLTKPAIALAGISDSDAKNKGFDISFVAPSFKGGIKTSGGLINTVINIVNALLVLAAIAAVVYIIISGIRYFSSQGDEDAVAQAKNGLISGIIGVIIIILSIVIIKFFTSQISTT